MENIRQNFEAQTAATLADVVARLDRIERLSNMAVKEVFSSDEAAEYLNISLSWLYHLTNSKQIPHYKNGSRRTFYKRSDLDEWMLRGRVLTNEEIEQRALNR